MKHTGKFFKLTFVSMLSAVILSACGGSGPTDPRETVIAFFGAMENDDQATLAHLLDLAELMKDTESDYALQTDENRVFNSPVQILEDLTGQGLTKTRWFSMQRIINRSEINGTAATVEVSFIDKESSKGYMTKFGLHTVDGKWKIYTFKAS
ncbi:MAG: hypothetical protein ACREBV_00735 [Candidatus Zixiibacteriota bacterium]